MMPRLAERHFRAMGLRFVAALGRAVPELAQEELLWRVHFMMGAMGHAMCIAPIFSQTPCEGANPMARMQRLVTFLGAGFRAPATAVKERT
jgi:hypothetical protein